MGTVSLSLAYGLIFGNIVLLPLCCSSTWATPHLGRSGSDGAGGVAGHRAVAVVGKNVNRVEPALVRHRGLPGFAAILWMRSLFNTQADFGTHPAAHAAAGRGLMAMFFIPLQSIAFSGLRRSACPRPQA